MTDRARFIATATIASVLACWSGLSPARADEPAAAPTMAIHSFPPASSQPAAKPLAHDRPTEAICKAALAWFDRAVAMVDKMVPAAEKAAERFIAGGTLYVAGNMGFCDEFDFRAGGFPFTVIYDREKPPGGNDVVMIGQFRPNEPEFRIHRFLPRVRGRDFRDGMVVCFTSSNWPQADRVVRAIDPGRWGQNMHVFDTGAPAGGSPVALSLGQTSATALAWAFCGEVIAAATRKGKTLATFASDWEPNGREWDKSVKGKHVHPKYAVPPIPPGKIGRDYLKACRDQLAGFLTAEPTQVRLAARRMAKCIRDGGMIWIVTDAHVHPRGSVVPPELPGVKNFGRGFSFRTFARRMPRTDMVLQVGYIRYPRSEARLAERRGVKVVTYSVDPGTTDQELVHIRSHWRAYDTVIDLPKYPSRVLPTSGVVGTPHWYSIMAETLAAYRQKP